MTDKESPIRLYRANAKMTLEQFGERFGVNKTTVMRWEEHKPPAERVLAIAKFTGIDPHVLRPDIYPRGKAA